MTIRHAINKALREQERSLYWLANASGVSYSRLHPFVRGKKTKSGADVELGTRNLERVMRALGMTMSVTRSQKRKRLAKAKGR